MPADDLRTSQLFADLSSAQAEALAAIAEPQSLPAGRVLFEQGDAGEALYLLAEGSVKVFKALRDGRTATMRHVRPGETFGESVLFADTYPAHAATTEPSLVYRFQTERFRTLLAADPDLALALLGRMAQLLVLLSQRVEELLQPVPARLARYLLELCEEQLGPQAGPPAIAADRAALEAPRICRLSFSKRELAARLGTVPETLSRTFDRFKRADVIRLSGSGELIEILDFKALRRLARV